MCLYEYTVAALQVEVPILIRSNPYWQTNNHSR